MLANKTIVLGITGSIAAYKAADIASKMTQGGAKVEVVLVIASSQPLQGVILSFLKLLMVQLILITILG